MSLAVIAGPTRNSGRRLGSAAQAQRAGGLERSQVCAHGHPNSVHKVKGVINEVTCKAIYFS